MSAKVTDITTADTIFFAIGVKTSTRGRKVFRADSASCGDKAFVLWLANFVAEANPSVPVFLVDAKDRDLNIRPNTLRLAGDAAYDDCGEDADVNLDALSDAEL